MPLDKDSINGWHHVTALIDRKELVLKLYLNGENSYDNPYKKYQKDDIKCVPLSYGHCLSNESIESSSPLVIGRRGDGKYGFSGWLDDIRIYKRVLSQDEIIYLASEDFLRLDDNSNKQLQKKEP